ncbi:hypothetical protein [Sorangium sp. So ce854]|uniref:hypothetical protein n=1 Tax=Sorangium sp. So ce854 TaxID=3133322 RepID=UPI003F640EAB
MAAALIQRLGPSGAGKSTVVERFCRSIAGPGTLNLLVHAGRVSGAAFEEEVLARLSAGPWPEGTGFDEVHFGVRTSLVNRIMNWDGEDGQPQLLIGLIAPDACVDWPDDPRRSVLDEPGPAARVLVAVSGTRDVAERWAERLGLRAAHVTYVSVDGFRLEEIDPSLRAHLAWAAVDGPGPRAHVDAIARSLRDRGAAPMEALMTTLACAFASLDVTELAPLLGAQVAEVTGSLATHREAVESVLQWREEGHRIGFRHETQRAAWAAAHPEQVALAEQRFAEVARAFVRTWESVDTAEKGAVTYLRRYAGDHLVSCGTPRADLLALSTPRWAWPRSREDLAARRAELGRVRRYMAAPLFASDAVAIPSDALSSFVRVALAQGALATLHRAWPPEADQVDEEA